MSMRLTVCLLRTFRGRAANRKGRIYQGKRSKCHWISGGTYNSSKASPQDMNIHRDLKVWCSANQHDGSVLSAKQPTKPKQIAKFCSQCGGKIELQIPPGEHEYRHVCMLCNGIQYYNPKMVVGVICEYQGKILLCKRAIEPCRGLWTLPAGFMEMNESTAEGAARETLEEASANVEIVAPYVHLDIPRIGQAYILFRAQLLPPYTYGPSNESLETVLIPPDEIPFDELAFSSISIALQFYAEEARSGQFQLHHGVVEKKEGSAPNDPKSYWLKDHRSFVLSAP